MSFFLSCKHSPGGCRSFVSSSHAEHFLTSQSRPLVGAVGQLTRKLWPSGLPFGNSPRIKHKPMHLYVDQPQDAKVFALLQNKGAVWTMGRTAAWCGSLADLLMRRCKLHCQGVNPSRGHSEIIVQIIECVKGNVSHSSVLPSESTHGAASLFPQNYPPPSLYNPTMSRHVCLAEVLLCGWSWLKCAPSEPFISNLAELPLAEPIDWQTVALLYAQVW